MLIYNTLELDKLDCTVAILKKVPSKRMGKKDIIKIGAHLDFDYDSLAYISPNITVNIIKDGELAEKKHIKLPKTLVDILKCKNPRCICSTEQDIQHIFWLSDLKTALTDADTATQSIVNIIFYMRFKRPALLCRP